MYANVITMIQKPRVPDFVSNSLLLENALSKLIKADLYQPLEVGKNGSLKALRKNYVSWKAISTHLKY